MKRQHWSAKIVETLPEGKQKGFSRFNTLVAGLAIITACYATYTASKRVPFEEINKSSICKVKTGGHTCYVDRDDTDQIENKLGDLYQTLNKKNNRVLRIAMNGFFVLHPERKNPNDPAGDLLGKYDEKTGNYHLYPGATLSVIVHEFLHKFFDKGFDEDEKQELKGKLLRLYEVSDMDEGQQKQLLGDRLTPELKSYLDGVNSIGKRLLWAKYGKTRTEYEELLVSELFSDIPFMKDVGVPNEFKDIYAGLLDGSVMAQVKKDININPILQK